MNLSSSLIIFAIIFSGCNGGSGGGSSENNSSGITLENHLGIWGACIPKDFNNDNVFEASTYNTIMILDNTISEIETIYSGTGCILANQQYKYDVNYSYTRSANTYSLVLQNKVYTSLSSSDVTWNNTNNWCGWNNWVINTPKNLIGRNCGGYTDQIGDTANATISKGGSNLIVEGSNFSLLVGLDLSPQGHTIATGSYTYSDGTTYAIYATFSGSTYQVYRYDLVSKFYNIENGNYSSSNNVANFTTTTSSPVGCISGSSSRRFATGSVAITLEFQEDNATLIAISTNMSESNFRNVYLGGGFSLACF